MASLGTTPLENSSRAKIRNIMLALYTHAMRWEFFNRNPITLVRQSAKRAKQPDVLTVHELTALLSELPELGRTAVFLAANQKDRESVASSFGSANRIRTADLLVNNQRLQSL